MKKIEVAVIEQPNKPLEMTNLAAKLTQHSISCLQDLLDIYHGKPSKGLVKNVQWMEHGSVTRHGVYTVAIVGASRRFLAQFRTHHVGIDFTSGSLQYQDMREYLDMVVPYDVYRQCKEQKSKAPLRLYRLMCKDSFDNYRQAMAIGLSNDTAGYVSCQASRNVLLITGNAEAWRNVVTKRSCNRNTEETQYVALLIWKELLKTKDGPTVFNHIGPYCVLGGCIEGKMACAEPITSSSPEAIIEERFPLLKEDFGE